MLPQEITVIGPAIDSYMSEILFLKANISNKNQSVSTLERTGQQGLPLVISQTGMHDFLQRYYGQNEDKQSHVFKYICSILYGHGIEVGFQGE